MKKKLSIAAVALCAPMLHAQSATSGQPGSEFKWAYEENGNDASLAYDGAWNYSYSKWEAGSSLIPGNQWNDIKTSLTEAYEGKSSIEINFNHVMGGEINLYLSTNPAGTGVEAASFAEKEAPKDISAYNTLRFFIKQGDWNGVPELSINLIENPNRISNSVRLSSYIKNWNFSEWKEVRIPLADLMAAGIDLTRIQEIWFSMKSDYYTRNGVTYIDNIGFIHVAPEGEAMPKFRYWWDGIVNPKGEYNYSLTRSSGGSSINTANQWGDVVVNGAFIGLSGLETSLADLSFTHSGSGFAEAELTTAPENAGREPTSFAERDAGKAIANSNCFLTFTRWTGNSHPIRIRLKDANGNYSASIPLGTYGIMYARYGQPIIIPTYAFAAPGFDFNQVKSICFFVDSTVPAGTYNVQVTNFGFQRK